MRHARADASCRYRIGHFVELTRGADVVLSEALPNGVAKRAHTVVCVRPCLTPAFVRRLAELRGAGIRLIADFDDLLFAGDVSGLPASARGSDSDERLSRYAASLDMFEDFIVSTRPLAARLRELRENARVSVVPNGLSASWVEQGRALYPRFAAQDRLVLRYFAGSPSHEHDFASILPVLKEFMARNAQVSLEIFGPLRVAMADLPAARVTLRDKIGYEQLPAHLASTWLNLAPLSPGEFNTCKSAIKFLESAAFGCPTLASCTDDLLRHQELGAPLLLCTTPQDWHQQLEAMLALDVRNAKGLDALAHVAAHGMASAHATSWLRALAPQGLR